MTQPSEPRAVILVIEDDPPIRKVLRVACEAQGYKVVEADSGTVGLSLAGSHMPDAVLLDLGLPDRDGIDVIACLREWSRAPVIVISARGREREKVRALDAGADDYVTKPFSVGEVLARIRVVLRRGAVEGAMSENADGTVAIGELHVDLGRRRVHLGEVEIRLTPIEFKLLSVFVRHPGKVLTHSMLMREVWGQVDSNQNLRVFVAGLRRKIESDPGAPRFISTEAGVGYRFADE